MRRALLLAALLLPAAARAERPYEPYASYQARFYQRLGAECIQRAGPDPSCFSLLETSLAFDPNAPIVHFTLGKYYAALGDLGKATGSFSRALELDPELDPALLALGDVYLLRQDAATAGRYYQRFVDRNPEDPQGYYCLGALAAQSLDEPAALRWLKVAIDKGFTDAARLKADPRWRNVVGAPALDALLAPLPAPTPSPG